MGAHIPHFRMWLEDSHCQQYQCRELFAVTLRTWFWSLFDGSWWLLMVIDGYWWLLMIIDDYWWLLAVIDGYWWIQTAGVHGCSSPSLVPILATYWPPGRFGHISASFLGPPGHTQGLFKSAAQGGVVPGVDAQRAQEPRPRSPGLSVLPWGDHPNMGTFPRCKNHGTILKPVQRRYKGAGVVA